MNSQGNYSYSASLEGLPDLPSWIQFTYNSHLKAGFLYGTPSETVDFVKLNILATNRDTYEVSLKEVSVYVVPKLDPARRQVRMKIHNLNVEDLMESVKLETLLDIFRTILWPESSDDIHLTELYSALLTGARRPARPDDGEGVILALGSRAEFSESLRDLQREVSPLWQSRPCPRDFKKTSMERYFRPKGFILDWCSFHLVPEDPSLVTRNPAAEANLVTAKPAIFLKYNKIVMDENGLWRTPSRSEVPKRSYVEDGVVAVFVPLIVLLILTGLLTAILGVHPEGKETAEGQLYEGVFEEFPCLKNRIEGTKNQADAQQTHTMLTPSRTRESVTPIHLRPNANLGYDLTIDSITRGFSPFLLNSPSATPSPTPGSTLSHSAVTTPHSTLWHSDRTSTLGRPEPPPYLGSLHK
nr:EOG090X04W0 [Cyclestheria hislopi]